VSKSKCTAKRPVPVRPYVPLCRPMLTHRIVRDDGGVVRVNEGVRVRPGLANVINGPGSVMSIFAGLAMRLRFWILLILFGSGMGKSMKGDVRMLLFSVARQRGL